MAFCRHRATKHSFYSIWWIHACAHDVVCPCCEGATWVNRFCPKKWQIMCILCTPRHSADMLMCRSTYRSSVGRYVDWDVSVDVSTNVSTEISAEWWSTYWPTIVRDLGWYSGWHSAELRWPLIVGGLSVDHQWYICQKLRLLVYKLYTFHPFLVNLKNLWRLYVRPSCAANSVVIKQDTQVKHCKIYKIQLTGKIRTMKDNKVLVWNWWKSRIIYKEASENWGVDQGYLRCRSY